MEQFRVVIGIPVFNEENTIEEVVDNFQKFADVFIVDDGSTDKTMERITSSNCAVLSLTENKGYENALLEIFDYFSKSDYTHLITADGDGQHTVTSIEKALDCISQQRDLQIAVGERDRLNRFSERIFSIASFPFLSVSDPLSGLKIYEKKFICKFLPTEMKINLGTSLLYYAKKTSVEALCFNIEIKSRSGSARVGSNVSVAFTLLKIFCFYFYHDLINKKSILKAG